MEKASVVSGPSGISYSENNWIEAKSALNRAPRCGGDRIPFISEYIQINPVISWKLLLNKGNKVTLLTSGSGVTFVLPLFER
ncbi:MAG: hypothetical protein QW087_00420 [Methanomassiliicoccales archaeon]